VSPIATWNGSSWIHATRVNPMLYIDRTLFVQKDFETFGAIMTMSDPQNKPYGTGGVGGGAIQMGHGFTDPSDMPVIVLTDFNYQGTQNNYQTLWIKKRDATHKLMQELDWGDLELENLTAHGDRVITIKGYSQINWNTSATQQWDDIGSIRFNNTADPNNVLSMEFKGTIREFMNGETSELLPIIEMVYLDPALTPVPWQTTHEFHPNGDAKFWGNFFFHGWLVPFDFMDDFAALRAIKTKVDKNNGVIYDPDSLKFLQDDKGFFSLGACVGWELSIQQKFLQEIDTLKTEIADLKSEMTTLKEK
jgi:hypothetical protein